MEKMMRVKGAFLLAGMAWTAAVAAATGCADFWVQRPRGDGTPVVRAADFGFSPTNDFNAAAINRALEHCRRIGAHTLELAPGTYSCFDVPHGITITNMTDFTFDGRGAILVFRRPAEFRCQPQSELIHESANLLVKDCERTLVCDFKMDWDWERDPLACFCRCTDIHVDEEHENASYVDLLFTDFARHPKYPEPVPVQKLQCMDESREAFANGPHWAFGFSEGHWGAKSEWLAPNRLRLYPAVKMEGRPFNPASDRLFSPALNVAGTRRFEKGRLYRLQHCYYGKNGINMVSNRHLTMREIDIWSCFGMGMVVDGKQEYWQIENVNIEPRPDAPYRRPVSSVSDAYHVARSRGHAKHVNMRIRFNNDDSFNFHDRFAIAERRGARTMEVAMNRGIGYFRPEAGDLFELRTLDWRPTGFTARFVRAEGNVMFLDRDIPDAMQGVFFVFDRAYGTDNVILRNCTMDSTAHRNLFSCSNLTIEDCTFNRPGSFPIRIIADARTFTWCEGLGETNIVIRGNTFNEPSFIARSSPVFSTVLMKQIPWKAGPDDPDFMRDILIEDNVIVDPYGPALRLESGTDIVFRNNEIRFTRPPHSAESGAMQNVGATGVTMDGNVVCTNPPPAKIVCMSFPEPQATAICTLPVVRRGAQVLEGGYVAESFAVGALVALSAVELDDEGRTLARHDSMSGQIVCATGFRHALRVPFTPKPETRAVRVEMVAAGGPVTFTPMQPYLRAVSKAPRYGGIYDKEDPPPADRAKALAELAAIRPPNVEIAHRPGRNVLLLDGKPVPFNQYKGFTDYRLTGECGGNMVITINRGMRLFRDATFDKADLDPATGCFDFSRIEDTLLRIHAANPDARVILGVDVDPDKGFLDRHPEAIFTNEKGVRGRANFGAFGGFDSTPLDPANKRVNWAYSYTSAAWREYVEEGISRLCTYLKGTPAANIVIGFHLSGGMDGQFVQWQYGPENGHFDYSEANRRALCVYLKEVYGTDAALQAAWGDPAVTLETARNPSVAEFRAHPVFDDRPGIGRRLADCRRFVAVGPARTLNGFARALKREFGRPCLVETWYTSSLWSQPGRLAVDELVKDGGVDVICTVTGYSCMRALDGAGGAADNSIAGLNLRGLIYVQEMDHRSWRTQHTSDLARISEAIPADDRAFASQLRRDAASVIAAGGAGFHLYDMYGSWYHGSKVMPAIREIYALNRFATENAGAYPLPRVAIFTDEKARLLCDGSYENANTVWRTSGVTPALHYLSDLDSPNLPDYDLIAVMSPVTLTAAQAAKLKARASRPGKVLALIGEAGCGSRNFASTADVLAVFGLAARHDTASMGDTVVRAPGVDDPMLVNWSGALGATGMYIKDGRMHRRYQMGYSVVTDTAAKVLGVWERNGGAAFVRKALGEGTFVFVARDGGLSPSLLNALARQAGVTPYAEPGNATYVGNGVACVHRLNGPARVDFGCLVTPVDPVTGKKGTPLRIWEPALDVGSSAAIGYLLSTAADAR